MKLALCAAAVAVAAIGTASAEPVQLKFAFIGTPTGNMNQHGMSKWCTRSP